MVCNKSIFYDKFFSKKLKKHQMSTTSQFWVDLSWLVCVALSFAWCLFTMFWSNLHFGMKTKCSGIWLPFQSCFKTWFEPNTGQGLLLKESGLGFLLAFVLPSNNHLCCNHHWVLHFMDCLLWIFPTNANESTSLWINHDCVYNRCHTVQVNYTFPWWKNSKI